VIQRSQPKDFRSVYKNIPSLSFGIQQYHLTDCNSFKAYVDPKIYYIDSLKDLVAEYLKTDVSKRRKRGVLDFVGEISKILFGTLTQADAREYNSHINQYCIANYLGRIDA
jgi:hypothetical protein